MIMITCHNVFNKKRIQNISWQYMSTSVPNTLKLILVECQKADGQECEVIISNNNNIELARLKIFFGNS